MSTGLSTPGAGNGCVSPISTDFQNEADDAMQGFLTWGHYNGIEFSCEDWPDSFQDKCRRFKRKMRLETHHYFDRK